MVKENNVIMREARDVLSGRWGLAVGVFFIYILVLGGSHGAERSGSFLSFILAGPFNLGAAFFSLSLARRQDASVGQLFRGFNYFGKAFFANLVITCMIVVGFILLVVPGVILALSYALTYYILAENPEIHAMDAMRKSRLMMNGYKMKLFYLGLCFLGLAILCVFTLGIGFLWLVPFVHVCMARFYDEIKDNTDPVSHVEPS
jgi:uncharacterized membrane protein